MLSLSIRKRSTVLVISNRSEFQKAMFTQSVSCTGSETLEGGPSGPPSLLILAPSLVSARTAQDLKVSLANECENLCAHICQLVRRCHALTRSLPNAPIETLYLIGENDT